MSLLVKLKFSLPACVLRLRLALTSSKIGARVFVRIFSYSTPKDRLLLLASLVASISAGASLPLMNILFASLVKTFSSLGSTSRNDIAKESTDIIDRYVLYIVYLFMARIILAYIAILGFRIISLRISATIRLHYLDALFQQPISTLDALPPGQTTAIITITANMLQLGISERLSSLIQAIAVILIAMIIGCIYSWELTLVTVTGLIAIVAWYIITTPLIMQRYVRIQELEREAIGAATEGLSSVKMIAAYCAQDKASQTYNKLVDATTTKSREVSPLLAVQHSPVFFTTFATFALCFWFAAKLYLHSSFENVETLVVVLMSVMTMLAHISAISVPLTAASNALNAAAILFTIIDAPKPCTTGVKGVAVPMDRDIVLENVNFAYPVRHDVRVLNGLNLHISAGKTTAIVGSSGSGKSTIVALIQRWYDLGSTDPVGSYLRNGSIKIGDVPLAKTNLYWWRSCIGLVQQEPFLFDDTIYKNVEYGLVGTQWEYAPERVKRQLVMRACREAYADEFVCTLPKGYLTMVGERGLHFSGGQRQRIAIARAIVRQPSILILDEATSALDVASERIVQAALNAVAKGRTTIVIAHRLSTIKHAHRIVVVAKGQVIQQGTHESLLADRNGPYAKLVDAQRLAASDGRRTELGFADNLKSRKTYHSIENSGNEVRVDTKSPGSNEDLGRTQKLGPTGFRSFRVLLAEQKPIWAAHLIMLVAAIAASVSSPLQAYLFAKLISSFAALTSQLTASTNFLCLMLLLLAIGLGTSYFTLGWVSNHISIRTVSTYRKQYFHDIISKRISFFDDSRNAIGLLSARLATDPAQLQQLLGINLAMVLIAMCGLVGCILIAAYFHWKFALVVMASSLPIILAGGWYRVRHEVKFEARNNEVFAESARFATEAIGAIRTVASLTLERSICEKYSALLKKHIRHSWKEARFSCMVFAASDSMILLCMAFALWYGGHLLVHGEILPLNFLVVYLAIIQGSLAAGQWLSFGPNFAQVAAAANRIQTMRQDDNEDETAVMVRFNEIQRWTLPIFDKGIEFRNVWFAYPTRDTPVLRGLSIRIPHGSFAAIVGSSGSGKTTMISLLERFYEPNRGAIEHNGDNIASIPLKILRGRMSLVAQEPYLFRGTIRQNVLLGVQEDDKNDHLLHQACRDAGIHAFISSLPDGYDTDIGTSGVSLSGGQKQRLSIARALIRDPTVLLLDEATSSLDSESEKDIQEVLERTGKGKTMIVVAHRLATVQRADIIFVMHQGRVIEQGNHRRLLKKRGVYWRMCREQDLGGGN